MHFRNDNRGIIKLIVIGIAVLLLLAYLGLNIRGIVASDTFQDNWAFIKGAAETIWERFLRMPVMFIWNATIGRFIWEPIVSNWVELERNKMMQMQSTTTAGTSTQREWIGI